MSDREETLKPQVRRRMERQERRLEREQRMLIKDFSSERAVMEEVFDRSTLMIIYKFLNEKTIEEIHGIVKAGKEARIYWGKGLGGRDLAIKIYLTVSKEFRKGMLLYIEGDPRFAHVRRDTRSLVYAWAQKEFKNLQRAYEAGVKVPKPITVQKNVLIMEFVGENGVSAPLLKETHLHNPSRIYRRLLAHVKRLYRKARLVHADLSEYNIMIWKDMPVIFDLSQAVPLEHPMANQFLRKDVERLHRYFSKLGVNVLSVEDMYRRITVG